MTIRLAFRTVNFFLSLTTFSITFYSNERSGIYKFQLKVQSRKGVQKIICKYARAHCYIFTKAIIPHLKTWGGDKRVKKLSVSRIDQNMVQKDEPRNCQQGLFNKNEKTELIIS